jgi:uncharacterized coiled-coil protein SlyX
MAKTNGHPAIKALEDEIAAVEKAQQPTRDQIAELEAQLVEGQQIIARNRAAIDVLNGNVSIASGAPRTRARRSSGTGLTVSQIDENAIVTFVGAHQRVGASQIGQHVGASGNALSLKLRAMVESGVLTKQGERRATKYSLKVG